MYSEGLLAAQFGIDVVLNGLTQGVGVAGSFGYDLNEDFGSGQSPRKVHHPGQSGELLIRVDVTTDFVVGSATPTAPHIQFHAVMSETQVFLTSGNDWTVVGSNVGPPDLNVGGQTVNGYLASDLTVGQSFFVRVNPWNTLMGRSILSATQDLDVRDLRYFGLVLSVPEAQGNVGGAGLADPFFSAGTVIGKMCLQSSMGWSPEDFIYPSAVTHVG